MWWYLILWSQKVGCSNSIIKIWTCRSAFNVRVYSMKYLVNLFRFEAKNIVFKFDHRWMNRFEFGWCCSIKWVKPYLLFICSSQPPTRVDIVRKIHHFMCNEITNVLGSNFRQMGSFVHNSAVVLGSYVIHCWRIGWNQITSQFTTIDPSRRATWF